MKTDRIRFAGREVEINLMESYDKLPSDFTPISIDTETTIKNGVTGQYGIDTIRRIQIADERRAFVFRDQPPDIDLNGLWASNSLFDEVMLYFNGQNVELRCAQLLSQLVDPYGIIQHTNDGTKYLHDLKSLIHKYLDSTYDSDKVLKARFHELGYKKKTGWTLIDINDPIYVRYAGLDAIGTAMVVAHYRPQMTLKLSKLLADEHRIKKVLKGIIIRGLESDATKVADARSHWSAIGGKAEKVITEAGLPIASKSMPDKNAWYEFLRGPYDMPITETGGPCLAKDAWERPIATLPADDDRRRLWVALTEANYANGIGKRYLDKFSGIVRPSFRQLGTLTGRITCTEPPLQQTPADDATIRACLWAGEGHRLLASDLNQVEMRMSACVSKDANLLRILEEEDMYATLSNILRRRKDIVKGMRERKIDKVACIALLYGCGLTHLAMLLEMDMDQTAEWRYRFRELFPRLFEWTKEIQYNQQIVLPNGFAIPVDQNRKYVAGNCAIQGAARVIHADGILRLVDAGLGDNIWNLMHDEVIIRVSEKDTEEAGRILQSCISSTFDGFPFPADLSPASTHWSK